MMIHSLRCLLFCFCFLYQISVSNGTERFEIMGEALFKINLKFSMWDAKRVYQESLDRLAAVQTRNDLATLIFGTKERWYENVFRSILAKNFNEKFSDDESGLSNIQEYLTTASANILRVLQNLEDMDQFFDHVFDEISVSKCDLEALKTLRDRVCQKGLQYDQHLEENSKKTSLICLTRFDMLPLSGIAVIFKDLEKRIKNLESKRSIVRSEAPQILPPAVVGEDSEVSARPSAAFPDEVRTDHPGLFNAESTAVSTQELPLDPAYSSLQAAAKSGRESPIAVSVAESAADAAEQDDYFYEVPSDLFRQFNNRREVAPVLPSAQPGSRQVAIKKAARQCATDNFLSARLNYIKWRDFFDLLKICQDLEGFKFNTGNNKVHINYQGNSFTIHNSQFDSDHRGRTGLAEFRRFLADTGLA